MNIADKNQELIIELDRIAEVAGFLWQRNWAEANGGNISVNLTEKYRTEAFTGSERVFTINISEDISAIDDNIFFVTGAGKRMRDIARSPLNNGLLIRVSNEKQQIEIIGGKALTPTSELPSHLIIQNFLKRNSINNGVVLHTHPTELIAFSHCDIFLDSSHLTHTLWSMIPEARVLVPKGIGIVPYALTGTDVLAQATLKELEKHDVLIWEKHGVLSVGKDIMECFDIIDVLSKAAQIYLFSRSLGCEPKGLSKEQLKELAAAFKLPDTT